MSTTTSRAAAGPDDLAADDQPDLHPISAASVRKLWPTEGHLFRDHLLRLDRDSRRLRFAHGVSDSFIEDYAGRMNDMGSLVFGFFVDGEIRAAAELRKLSDNWGVEAEAAFSVDAKKHEADLRFEYGEVIGEIIPSGPDYFSLLAEAADDRVGYMMAVLDLSSRLVKAA
jgi:hypothetical protein